MDYAKFYLSLCVVFASIGGLWLGGGWSCLGFGVIVLLMIAGDALLGVDLSQPKFKKDWVLKIPLYLCFPLMVLLHISLALAVHNMFLSPKTVIVDLLALAGGCLTMMGYGIVVGHELVHMTRSKLSVTLGRLLYSMIGNPDFSIEHVYIHHAHLGTDKDPATAKKGESVYRFFFRSSYQGHVAAWRFELERLKRCGSSFFSYKNKMLSGYLMCLIWPAIYFIIGGFKGLLVCGCLMIAGKFIFEAINYVEHYGLVRGSNEAIAPHHSWNCNTRMSYSVLLGLARHSAHHEKGQTPYWQLPAYPDAPQMPYGYLISLLTSMVPPLWFAIMEPKLQSWRKQYLS